jgi:hypothetical protein
VVLVEGLPLCTGSGGPSMVYHSLSDLLQIDRDLYVLCR